MSAFSSSSQTALLDSAGNINTARLSQELTAALDFDIKYKQVDNMKKRAVRTAGSYDEFRNLVAAAHLKKVSRKEVESLSDVKKGWRKGSMKNSEGNMLDLQADTDNSSLASNKPSIEGIGKGKKVVLPRTSMELDRNLRRCADDTERVQYLHSLQREGVTQLLVKAIDIELWETVWRVTQNHYLLEAQSHEDKVYKDWLSWLEILVKVPKFDMLLRLAPTVLAEQTLTLLHQRQDQLSTQPIAFSEEAESDGIRVQTLITAFSGKSTGVQKKDASSTDADTTMVVEPEDSDDEEKEDEEEDDEDEEEDEED